MGQYIELVMRGGQKIEPTTTIFTCDSISVIFSFFATKVSIIAGILTIKNACKQYLIGISEKSGIITKL